MAIKKFFRFFWLVALLFTAVLAVKQELEKDDYGVFEDIVFGLTYLVVILLSVAAFVSWLIFYNRTKSKAAYFVFVLPLVILVTLASLSAWDEHRQKVPFFLAAGPGDVSLFLRIDSTYQITSHGDLSGYSRYGNFTMNGDTVYLDGLKPDAGLQLPKLVIKKDKFDSLYKTDLVVEQVNQLGQYMDTIPYGRLRVYADKRKPEPNK
jgi:hypothetical protein